MDDNRSNRRAPRLLRWLLALYPPEHRARYGPEIEACLLRELEQRGGGGRFWAGTVADHLIAAAAVRRRGRRHASAALTTNLDDLRHAARSLRRAPVFTAFAALTLALGIGATTAAFSVLDRVVLRPLPYPGAERIVVVGPAREGSPGRVGTASAPLMEGLRASPGPAEAIVGISRGRAVLEQPGNPARVYPAEVTDGFFSFFGATPAAGRLFTDADYAPGASPVVVLSHGFWTSRFGGDPAVLGTNVVLDSLAHTVVGVLARDFVPPEPVPGIQGELWVPLRLADRIAANPVEARIVYTIWAAARLRPGATPGEMDAHASRVLQEVYGTLPRGVTGATSRDLYGLTVGEVVGPRLRQALAAVALLLVISCVNVAGLLLTRNSERARELTVRAALGAGRARLTRQLLMESALLGLAGGVLGGGAAFLAVDGFRRFSPGGVPRLGEVGVDARALGFAFAASLAAVLFFGLLPALAASRPAARARSPHSLGRGGGRLRGALVFAEVGLAVLLVVGSGLLARDLTRRVREDPGYRPEALVAASVTLPEERYPEGEAGFWRELVEGARALPGVVSVAVATELPTTDNRSERSMTPEGSQEPEMVSNLQADVSFAGTVGLRILNGRWFSEADEGGEPAVVVNDAFARAYWPDGPAVERTIQILRTEHRVVGVAADARVQPGVGPMPKVYRVLPYPVESSGDGMELVVRVEGDPSAAVPELRALVRRLDPGLVDASVRTVASLNAQALARPRFYTALFSVFGLAALLLALVGVYGTTAYAARARTREIGIRMALGARRAVVVVEIALRTLRVVAAGVAAGLVVASLGSRALAGALLTIGPRDATTYAVAAALALAAGGAAGLIPAGRAARVDPATTLRDDG
jgi:predicted permease